MRRIFVFLLTLGLSATLSATLSSDLFALGPVKSLKLKGFMGERYHECVEHWLLTVPQDNPGMLDMYSLRNGEHAPIVSWYGEFSGKYLTSVALAYALEHDPRLKAMGDYVVDRLALVQDTDGYLGVWPDAEKFIGRTPVHGGKTWDVWAHYHNMLGLYYWYRITGSVKAFDVLERAARCIFSFYFGGSRLFDEVKDGTDAAAGHIFALLYELTGKPEYLDMVNLTYDSFAAPKGGNYFADGLAGVPFYQMKRHRWECLHAIETIAEMYRIGGNPDQLTALANIWESIARYDRHNTGAFSSGESACGNPYDLRAIETCCTVAWMALGADYLSLTGDSRIADELEWSLWNEMLGAQLVREHIFTYNTPMMGVRRPSTVDIAFQRIDESPQLNCCSVNAPRVFGMIAEWAATATDEAVTLNYYGESEMELATPSGRSITVTQTGAYPFGSGIKLTFKVKGRYRGMLSLRIPAWSKQTQVLRNGEAVAGVAGGQYLELERLRNGDEVIINFDMSPRYWHGEREVAGKSSVYCGPILLALDERFDPQHYADPPVLDLSALTLTPVSSSADLAPALLVKATDAAGNSLILCDFASAGQAGTSYTTWLPVLK